MKTSKNYNIEIVKNAFRFTQLDENVLKEIAARATSRYFRKREYIFHEGDRANRLYILKLGRVKLFKVSSSGREFISHIAVPPNTLNLSALFGKEHFLTAQCIDDTSILCLRREEFFYFVNRHPSIAIDYIATLGELIDAQYEKIMGLLDKKADMRITSVLFMLSLKFGTTLSFTCSDIANLVGTTTETVIRVISRLKKMGILCSSRGRITILDETKLQGLGQPIIGGELIK